MSIEDQIIQKISEGLSIAEVKNDLKITSDNWHRISESTYRKYLANEKASHNSYVGIKTSLETTIKIQSLNKKLNEYALSIPPYPTTEHDFNQINEIFEKEGCSEKLIQRIAEIHINPSFRVRQELGMIEHFSCFEPYLKIIQAATLCYYRQNFISCYLTLTPCIEGIIQRWNGIYSINNKANAQIIKNFFKKGFQRNPRPSNPIFYEIFTETADQLLAGNFFLNNAQGNGFSNFNRHIALHMIDEPNYLTQANCIRLFTLLDLMLEIYFYENPSHNHRFYLDDETVRNTSQPYVIAQYENILETPEKQIFK